MTAINHSICFLGTGKITAKHLSVIQKLKPSFRLSVASRDFSRAQEMQSRFGLAASFGSYDEVFSSDFSTIVIATPPRLHLSLVEKALQAGKNILIEKPVFNSLEEFQKVWGTLKNHSRFVMVLENQWFDPFFQKIRNILKEHDFGRPLFLDLVRLGVQKQKGWRADPAEMPLGALHEGGVHWIRKLLDLANLYESDPASSILGIRAYAPKPLTNTPCEDTMLVVARHRSGLVSRLLHSWGIPGGFFDISKITLEKGTIFFNSRGIWGLSRGAHCQFLTPCLGDLGGFKAMWRHIFDCLETGQKPHVTLEDIYLDFGYLDAAYRSSRSHQEEFPMFIPRT